MTKDHQGKSKGILLVKINTRQRELAWKPELFWVPLINESDVRDSFRTGEGSFSFSRRRSSITLARSCVICYC